MKQLIASIPKNRRETARISLDEFAGHQLVDLRLWFSPNAGSEPKPSPKGLSLDVKHLPALRAAIEEAERVARAAGLLELPGDRGGAG